MDVLHITEACGGGVRRHLSLVLPELMGQGVSCGLFAYGGRMEPGFLKDAAQLRDSGCKVDIFPQDCGRLKGLLPAVRRIHALCREWQPRALHLHAFAAGAAGRLAGWPNIIYSPHAFGFHAPHSWILRSAIKMSERFLEKRSKAFVLVGPDEMRDAQSLGIPPEKLHLIHNGLPCPAPKLPEEERQRIRHNLGILPDDTLAALVPCRLEPQKGLQSLMEAIPHIKPNVRFYFCGDGTLKASLCRMAEKLSLGKRIVFTGQIENLPQMMRAFDLAVIPSYYEGLSYSLLEVLSAALPLAASDIDANHPIPELKKVTFPFPPGNINAMASAVNAIIADMANAAEKANQAQKIIEQTFTLKRQANLLKQVYSAFL